jgi:murein DD-endopeptidase MepM/ murein hydrolase activator NlpD
LDQTKPRGAIRSKTTEVIELGNEPPLSVDGSHESVDRRRVPVQWFAGTILTALCGAVLMGGAVFTSLDGQTHFASLPEHADVVLRGAIGASGNKNGTHKSDRLPITEDSDSTHKIIRVSMVMHSGNHEVVRVRPFVHVASNLALTRSELSANIAPFNPQRLLADATSDGTSASEIPPAGPDAEVSFIMHDLAPLMPRLKIALLSPKDEVTARVREAAEWARKTTANVPDAANITGIKLAYAGQSSIDPYAGFGARVVPENITLLPKTASQTNGGNPFNEKVILAKNGDSVADILRDLGSNNDDIAAIIRTLESSGTDDSLKEGQRLRVLMSPVAQGSKSFRPIRVVIATESTRDAAVALADNGMYVQLDVNSIGNDNDQAENAVASDQNNKPGVRLYESMYETALSKQIPRPVIDDLVRIYAFDTEFERKVQPGDSFEVLYAGENDTAATDNSHGEILFASLTIGGEVKNFYRFQSPDDGRIDYYDKDGKSAKKFLLRKPVAEGTIRSGFGLRQHPILGYTKMHTGVDWAAPIGTPIYAAGNGVVEKAGWESGYGKFVLLRHNNGYESAYGHMSVFARGLEEGVHVRQGQVIGFVGSTGLSTGPHVHYEIRVNERFVDPMRIKLPQGRELEGSLLAEFERERERIDGIMVQKPARVAAR